MRHRVQKNPSFGRHRGPRKALIRGLLDALVENERIKITLSKAQYLRPLMEKAITKGKKGDLNSHRILLSLYPNKKTVHKIVHELAPRFKDRQGGYTRIIKIGLRPGDQAPIAFLEFVDYKPLVKQKKVSTDEKETKKPTYTKESKKLKKLALKKSEVKRKTARQIQKKSRKINRG